MLTVAGRSPIGAFGASSWRHDREDPPAVTWNLRIRAELLDTYEMNVNHKLVSAIMTELGIAGLPRPGKRKPNLLGVEPSLTASIADFRHAGRTNCGSPSLRSIPLVTERFTAVRFWTVSAT